MFPQWGFWVLWFLHGMSHFGCFKESWFLKLAAHHAVIGLTLSLKLSTCSKNSLKVDQNSFLSQLLPILCLHSTFFCTSRWCCWTVGHTKACGLPWDPRASHMDSLCESNSQAWRHPTGLHLFDFKTCSSSLLVVSVYGRYLLHVSLTVASPPASQQRRQGTR